MVSRCVCIVLLAGACLPAQTQVTKFGAVTVGGRVEGQTVKGAPYSAVAVTEFVQTLADGNRIVNKTTSAIARDSEGRTRRVQTLAAIGPFAAEGANPPQLIFIEDPVAHANYLLDPATHTAHKTPFLQMMDPAGAPAGGVGFGGRMKREFTVRTDGPVPGPGMPPPPPPPPGQGDVMYIRSGSIGGAIGAGQSASEPLGAQTMEGVTVEGTRTTTTIAAGVVGNERPIEVVTESWYSPDLQVIVYSKRDDPRMGQDTYRLTGIQRAEPPAALFTIPADYKLEEGGPGPVINFQQKVVR